MHWWGQAGRGIRLRSLPCGFPAYHWIWVVTRVLWFWFFSCLSEHSSSLTSSMRCENVNVISEKSIPGIWLQLESVGNRASSLPLAYVLSNSLFVYKHKTRKNCSRDFKNIVKSPYSCTTSLLIHPNFYIIWG